MSSPIAFMSRRARLIRGETQAAFARHIGVDQATVSRWETEKGEPDVANLQEIRRIVMTAEPCHSEAYVSASPTIKYVAKLDDFSEALMVSQGYVEVLGVSREDILTKRELRWDDEAQRVNDIVQADSCWLRGEIAFFEATFKADTEHGEHLWWRTIGAPLSEAHAMLWEGVLTGSPLEFSVKLTPFQEMDDDA